MIPSAVFVCLSPSGTRRWLASVVKGARIGTSHKLFGPVQSGVNVLKAAILLLVNVSVLAVAVYYDVIRDLPPALQGLLIAIVGSLQTATSGIYDYLRMQAENIRLKGEEGKLKLEAHEAHRQLDEFKEVVVSFLEHSSVYRERIKEELKLKEDYLCIVKSSEGLGEVYNATEVRERFPFGAVLRRLPGAVQPFERIALFLIPIASLPGINEWNIQTYISKRIIPEVRREREEFLARLPRRVASRAEEFSYKYIAFPLRKGTIAYEVLNRKFNREFIAFVVDEQTGAGYRTMKRELQQLVRTKDLLSQVNWASFADLNPERRAFVEGNRERMSAELTRVGKGKLSDIAKLTPEELQAILSPVLRKRITDKKLLNLSGKLVEGASHTVDVLRRNGISL